VTVIDTSDPSVVKTIDMGHPVAAADADQTLQRVYALDFSNGTPGTNVHEIDGTTNIETADITIGSRLQNIALDPEENRGYATDFEDGVIVLNTSTLAVVTTLALSDLPHGVAVHPVLDFLYVTQIDGDTVTVFNTTTNGVVDVLTVGDSPQWIGLDLVRNKGFVTNEGDRTVSVIDLVTNTVKPGAIPVGTEPLTVTIHEAAAKAYVYNVGDGTISVIDTVNEIVIATIDVLFADGFELGDATAWSSSIP
jgi:YVTN family beta-propeller protein